MFDADHRPIRLFLGMVFAGLLLYAAPAQAEEWQAPEAEYTGLMTAESEGERFSARIFRGPERIRMEMDTGQGPAVMIVNHAANTAFMLIPSQRMYMALPVQQAQARQMGNPDPNARLERMGGEQVNGVDATKYRVSREDPAVDGFEGFAWLTDDWIVVRMDGTQHSGGTATPVHMNLTELEVGDLDDSLFQVPDGYRSMGGR